MPRARKTSKTSAASRNCPEEPSPWSWEGADPMWTGRNLTAAQRLQALEDMIEWVRRLPEPIRRRVLADMEANRRNGGDRQGTATPT